MKHDAVDVLVVEDEPLLRNVYCTILSSNGYNVTAASNGLEALQELETVEPRMILLDYFMPQMDGRTFMLNFNRESHKDVKIVVISNIADEDALQEMLKLGADAYVLKADVAPKDLVKLVNNTVQA